MALKYYLIRNNLMAQPNVYMARSQRGDTLKSEQLADLMVQRGSTLTKSDIIAAENLRFEVIQEMLQLGFNIADQWMTMSPCVRGTFNGPADNYDPTRHSIRIRFSPNKFTRSFQSGMQAQRVIAPKNRHPALYAFMDYGSRTINEQVSIGKTVKLTGTNLLFNPDDPQQGLFFTDAETGATLAKVHYVMEHKPSWVLFEVPETLAAGKYVFLELRSNELRKEQLQDVLLTTS